jgi:hypothetical protein
VPPGELFDVELFDVADAAAPRLPARVTPLAGEALASWLLRFARPGRPNGGANPTFWSLRRSRAAPACLPNASRR